MWTWVIEKLIEYFPQIAGYVCLIFIVAFITIKVYKFYFFTKSACEKFECFSDTLNTISRGLETLNKILLEKKVIDNSCYSETHSPIDLNELGNQLYKESGAEQVFEKNKEKLLKELEKNYKQDTKFEVQRNSLRILLDKMDDAEFKILQRFAYNNPKFRNNPLTYSDILYVMSLKLRNQYIEKHPEITE